MKLLYIHAYRGRFGVEPICAVLSEHDMKIAPGTYYKWLARPVRRAELDEAYLVNERHRRADQSCPGQQTSRQSPEGHTRRAAPPTSSYSLSPRWSATAFTLG